jgi:autotransporter-associated beta strand protein
MRTWLAELRTIARKRARKLLLAISCTPEWPDRFAAFVFHAYSYLYCVVPPDRQERQMSTYSAAHRWLTYLTATSAAWGMLLFASAPSIAQTRVTGLDVSWYQGVLSQSDWDTLHNTDGRAFTFIRSSRGGTTGNYYPGNTANDTLARRYDDPYFVQNITFATNAGMFAGPYHFGRPDVIATTSNANGIPNNGTDEANHMIESAGAWMRPGYLLPVYDFETGAAQRTPSELAQFAIDFSDRIYAVKGIRPAVYIGNNYASPMDSIPEAATIAAAYPTLWNARWPSSPDIQNKNPGDYTSTIYGPWDNPPNPGNPWAFWQYTSSGRLQGISNGTAAVDLDVAHGGIEYVKDHLVPALWLNDSSGDWSALANWNSGETPVPPVTGPGQLPPTSNALPTTRLPGPNDTVVLDRTGANITVTLASGTQNIRKLYVHEALNITGGTLNVGYVPTDDSTPFAAEFSDAVTLSGSANLSVHSIQVDVDHTFTLGGGTLTFNTITLAPDHSNPAKIALSGNVNFTPLSNATATIASSGSSTSGLVDLTGATRTFNVANGTSDVDLAINVPVTNGGLIKAGAGTLALNGTNTYTGNTTVQAGRLRLAKASLADTSNVYLSNGATLDLNFSGSPDYVHAFYINGVAQANGIWGPIGSGAPFTSSLLTGTGKLYVTPIAPPPPPPGDILDDFEINEGHFGWAYNYSPAPDTYNLAATSAIDRVTTDHQGFGTGSQLLNLVASGAGAWQLRHNSGIGTNLAGEPAGNVRFDATGYVGFWLKTDHAGVTVRIGIDDPVDGNTALERGYAQNIIADNQWHLYQWNLENDNHWEAYSGGANGAIDAPNGTVSIDSIWFNGIGDAQIYLDNVSHNALGLLAASAIAGDYNGDGVVNVADYTMWRSMQGTPVTPGTKADGNGNGIIDAGDYITWRKLISMVGGSSISGASIPEPTALLLAIIALALLPARRSPLAA